MEKRECRNCIYYDDGECRRYPPVLKRVKVDGDWYLGSDGHKTYDEDVETTWGFPYVGRNDWCGEFSTKSERLNKRIDDVFGADENGIPPSLKNKEE